MMLNQFFSLQEFLSKLAYFDMMKLLRICTYIRSQTKMPVIINDWHRGGTFNQRGLRLPYNNVGSQTSEHRNFRAVDINIGDWSAARMFDWCYRNADKLYELGVGRIEHSDYTPTWLHLDCRDHGKKAIQIISPSKVVDEIKIV